MSISYDLKNELFALSAKKAKHTLWVMADIQQFSVEETAQLMEIVKADFPLMKTNPEWIWFLGDATQKKDNSAILGDITATFCRYLDEYKIPVCAVNGNHDMDYAKEWSHETRHFLWEEVQKHPTWKTIEKTSDLYFTLPLDDEWVVYFFSDCMADDHAWWTSHGYINGDKLQCPYNNPEYFQVLRAKMASESRKIITASHYSFMGGNRQAPLMSKMMPLPSQVKMHFYGHAHISELSVCYESAYKRMAWADWHDIPMYDCASISNRSDAYSRTCIVHLYEDGSAGVFWRNHDQHRFEECFISSTDTMKEGLTDYLSTHPNYKWYRE